MKRVREEESDYFYIYDQKSNGEVGQNILIVRWFVGKLEIGSEAGLITQEEFTYLSEWVEKTRPIAGYRINKVFDEKPLGVWLRSEYHNPDGAFLVNENEIEEVWK